MSHLAPAVLLASLLVAGTPATQESVLPWDQKMVTGLAESFSKAVDELYHKANVEQQDPKGLASRADVYVIVEDLKQLKRYSSRFAGDLRKGKDRDATQPLFERMLDIVQRLGGVRQKTPILMDATQEVAAAREILFLLTRYYGTSPPPPVTPPGPSAR